MNIAYYFVVIILVSVLIKELLYIKDLKISTIKTPSEVLIVLITMIVIIVMSIILATSTSHYILGCVGIALLIVDWTKQGVSTKGLLITARGKELYKWEEISKINITVLDKIKVDYFNSANSKIITHIYSFNRYDKLKDTFNEHNLNYQAVNPGTR